MKKRGENQKTFLKIFFVLSRVMSIFFKLLVLLNYSWIPNSKIEIVKVQADKWKTSLSKLARCLPCFSSGGEEKEWQIELQQHSHIWWESQVLDSAKLLTTNECSHISKQNLRFCAICRFLLSPRNNFIWVFFSFHGKLRKCFFSPLSNRRWSDASWIWFNERWWRFPHAGNDQHGSTKIDESFGKKTYFV